MELVLVLVVILVLGLAAVGATVATSRRSQRRRDVAERAAVDRAVTEPRPKAEPKAKPGPTAKPKGEPPPGPADIEIVLPSGDDLVLEPDAGIPPEEPVVEAPGVAAPAEPPPPAVRPRLRDRLGKARALLAGYFGDLRSRSVIDDEVWDDLEEALIRADVGVTVTAQILDDLRRRVKESAVSTPSELLDLLKADLVESMRAADRSLAFSPGQPNVWMFVGVNGVGKTTSIGKIAQREAASGRKVVMAAADTFRAAAAEQLQLWSQRVGADLVLVDTAGRLHTKVNLMEELKKLRRIVDRTPGALKEVLLVIDASTGQNGLNQAKIFGEAVEVTGVILTKLDGTAKGGIVLAVQQELGIPVKLVGVGESAEDLIDFDPEEFVEALFAA